MKLSTRLVGIIAFGSVLATFAGILFRSNGLIAVGAAAAVVLAGKVFYDALAECAKCDRLLRDIERERRDRDAR